MNEKEIPAFLMAADSATDAKIAAFDDLMRLARVVIHRKALRQQAMLDEQAARNDFANALAKYGLKVPEDYP